MRRRAGDFLNLSFALLLVILLTTLRYGLLTTSPPTDPVSPPAQQHRTRRIPARLLPHIEGLDHLFPPPPNSSAHAVWARMRPLLARSDALASTATGVREAAAAWLALLPSVSSPPSHRSKRSCPFSVTAGAGKRSMPIPCGLVQDAAVTLIAAPVALNNSFRFEIELVGPDDVVALRYNVSLVSGGAARVAQSSWMPDNGWSKWELCPTAAHNSSNSEVDGLVLCNEQLNGSVVTDGVNVSETEIREKSVRHSGPGFPFIDGQPFTATLWAGVEGFHMTVNGRHETSFVYKERLDPWLVSEVKVTGDVELISAVANGLPVSEDFDIVGDAALLRAPPLEKNEVLLLVGIFSAGSNFKRRMALRRTWMQYEAVRAGTVAVRFFTGLHTNQEVNLELWRESQMYQDIQLMPFVDYYSLITLKTVAICILGTRILPAKYIMKTDDDAFVRIDEVLSSLGKFDPRSLLYGLISFQSSPQRDQDSKWFVNSQEWPYEAYPPWAHGPGYVISRDVAEFVVRGHEERVLQLFKLEDVAMGIWIQEYKDMGHEVRYITDERFHNTGCESKYVLAHYQSPRLLLCLWEKLHKESKPLCCE